MPSALRRLCTQAVRPGLAQAVGTPAERLAQAFNFVNDISRILIG